MARKRYAIVGVGSRSGMYLEAIAGRFADVAELAALCDPNRIRMRNAAGPILARHGRPEPPLYGPEDFGRMLAEARPDALIVTSVDRTHHRYIGAALERGLDVITEKPLTVDADKCQRIVDAAKASRGRVTVTFNYRYSPRNTKIKEVLASGAIGQVLSVHFEWLLDTRHGADYFRRWHRDKRNSGGLMVHKATHHFDLVNWWLDSEPETVFAMGDLRFYGKANAEERGATRFYQRSTGSPAAAADPFALHLDRDPHLKALYLDAEGEDGYLRDQSVFGDNISIEDTMGVMVRYRNRAILTYSLNAHCPWEGYRVMFNGTAGRLEVDVHENTYVSGSKDDLNRPENYAKDIVREANLPTLLLQRHWGRAEAVPFEQAQGGHGGGDARMLDGIFRGQGEDPLGHAAGLRDGVMSILVGVAANRCFGTGQPVRIDDLVRF